MSGRIPEQMIEAIQAILNTRHVAEDCNCDRCEAAKQANPITCETCGYTGIGAAITCACYDCICPGGDQHGSGCFHGGIICPICDDGESISGFEIVKAIREVISGVGVEDDPGTR